MAGSRKTITAAVGSIARSMHVWRMPSKMRRFHLEIPSMRQTLAFWAFTGFIWVVVVGILSIGVPEWGIFPDSRLHHMAYSPIFWVSIASWCICGSTLPYVMVRWGPDRFMTYALVLVFAAFVTIYLNPFVSAAYFPGLMLGMAVEGSLIRVYASPTMFPENPATPL